VSQSWRLKIAILVEDRFVARIPAARLEELVSARDRAELQLVKSDAARQLVAQQSEQA
jgi:uncharacterized membrane protein YheB (UPF0754 family)